jgi:hypothetical protein
VPFDKIRTKAIRINEIDRNLAKSANKKEENIEKLLLINNK